MLPNSRPKRFRLTSLAGTGLTERMRSITFAVLGLVAAAGLALVAIFALPGWPLLDPAPLPSSPAQTSAVDQGVAVEHGPAGSGQGGGSTLAVGQGTQAVRGASGGAVPGKRHGGGGSVNSPVAVNTAPVSGGGAQPQGSGSPAADPVATPAPSPEAAPAHESVPVSSSPGKNSSRGSPLPGHSTASANSGSNSDNGKDGSAGHTGSTGKSVAAAGHNTRTSTAGAPKHTSHPAPPPAPAPAAPSTDAHAGGPPTSPPGRGAGKGNGKGNGS
jgi:hypothetical protein